MRYIFISSHQCTLAKLKFTSSNCHLCFLFAAFCVLPLKYVHVLLRLWLFPFLIFHPFYLFFTFQLSICLLVVPICVVLVKYAYNWHFDFLLFHHFLIFHRCAYLLSPLVSYLLKASVTCSSDKFLQMLMNSWKLQKKILKMFVNYFMDKFLQMPMNSWELQKFWNIFCELFSVQLFAVDELLRSLFFILPHFQLRFLSHRH